MDTIMTLVPIVIAILSGLWVAYHRKHKTPWIKTWLKAMTVLVGVPIGAYIVFRAMGLGDADVKWLIAPLTFMLMIGTASVVGVVLYGIVHMLINNRPQYKEQTSSEYQPRLKLRMPSTFLFLWTFRTWW